MRSAPETYESEVFCACGHRHESRFEKVIPHTKRILITRKTRMIISINGDVRIGFAAGGKGLGLVLPPAAKG